MSKPRSPRMEQMREGLGVTPLELFFDLVFVYAITQVTALMAHDLNWHMVVRGMLVLVLLWWCWCGFAWLGNTVRADEGVVRLALLGVMAIMLVVAVTIPEAFGDLPGGLPGPVVFTTCYLAIRVLHLTVYWFAAAGDSGLRRQLVRLSAPMFVGTVTLMLAAFQHGVTQTLLWALALAVDYGGVMLAGSVGWRVNSAAHFAERHGLIIIIALGESIVSIGVGVLDQPVSWPIIAAILCGVAISGVLWWAYFDVVAVVAERVLAQARGVHRAALARDSYSYLHLPMVAGIVLLSLGLKKVLIYVSHHREHSLTEPLTGIPLIVLYGGVVLYLAGHLGFRLRNIGSVNIPRLVTAVLLLALVPVAWHLPALAALGLLAGVCVLWISFEVWRYRDARYQIRHLGHQH